MPAAKGVAVNHRPIVVAALVSTLAACTIEPTPREYIDRPIPVTEVGQEAEKALRDRITVAVQALQAGDVEAARVALSPTPGVVVVGPAPGQVLSGDAHVMALLESLVAAAPASIELTDLRVEFTPDATAGWFVAMLELRDPRVPEPVPFRLTGVYVSREATWELRQAHLSLPANRLTSRPSPAPQQRPDPAPGGAG
jgi:hypothetical protein